MSASNSLAVERERPSPKADRFNTLIISDLHLGEDLRPSSASAPSHHIDLVERELVAFLRHYARKRHDGRPWRLVINGDMVDFLAVCLLPGGDGDLGDLGDRFTPEEHVYGVGRRPREARAKMAAVIARHQSFFQALAAFAAAGNAVEITAGNHDAELHWPIVQEAFRRGVTDAWLAMPESQRQGARGADELAASIHFHPWFFYEPGVMWVEHGHQYDECCSFEYGLNPVHPESEQILPNVDAAGLRYITNQIPDSDPHQQDEWSFGGYARWAFGMGLRGLWRVLRSYCMFAVSLLAAWRWQSRSPKAHAVRERTHRERLRALCERWRLSEPTLVAIDALRRRPVITNLGRLVRLLMLDKIFILAVTLLFVLVAVLSLPWLWAIGVALTAVGTAWLMARVVGRGRAVDPAIPMLLVPERILRHVDARFVVFGHSHDPVIEPLPGGRLYFNTGTWVPTQKPGLLRSFTHLVVRHGEHGPQAELCQWRDGASRTFTPDRPAPRLAVDLPPPAAAMAVKAPG